ncbi:MAG: HD domain-containing protein [Anaerolineae bacterium]|nr:HD domain-containing protein [Anaerolineae bacterium]
MPIAFASRDIIKILQRMAYIAEYREGDNHLHLERMKGYTYIIAREIGLDVEGAELISVSCQLHDIGKFIIPDEISHITGELSPEEWRVIKKHTSAGASLLQGFASTLIQTASQVALSHHERWDGSGYPHKLVGEDIPLGARICAIADVFDALTTRRIYKAEITVIAARDLIAASSGVLFDPEIVKIFQAKYEDIAKFRSNNLE